MKLLLLWTRSLSRCKIVRLSPGPSRTDRGSSTAVVALNKTSVSTCARSNRVPCKILIVDGDNLSSKNSIEVARLKKSTKGIRSIHELLDLVIVHNVWELTVPKNVNQFSQ